MAKTAQPAAFQLQPAAPWQAVSPMLVSHPAGPAQCGPEVPPPESVLHVHMPPFGLAVLVHVLSDVTGAHAFGCPKQLPPLGGGLAPPLLLPPLFPPLFPPALVLGALFPPLLVGALFPPPLLLGALFPPPLLLLLLLLAPPVPPLLRAFRISVASRLICMRKSPSELELVHVSGIAWDEPVTDHWPHSTGERPSPG